MLNSAITTLLEEHRSLKAIVYALRFVLSEARSNATTANFKALRAILHYIDTYAEQRHHPKEERYLFARLRQRTHVADRVLDVLEAQHTRSARRVDELRRRLEAFERGDAGSFAAFANAAEHFSDLMWQHMHLEESVVLPLARMHLTGDDWTTIAEAFGENGDPCLQADADDAFAALLARIVQLAPPPIGNARPARGLNRD